MKIRQQLSIKHVNAIHFPSGFDEIVHRDTLAKTIEKLKVHWKYHEAWSVHASSSELSTSTTVASVLLLDDRTLLSNK